MANDRIELSQLLQYVSQELQAADAKARAAGLPVMQFDECKLEIAVSAEREGSGGVKVWVLNLSGGAKKSESHTITVTMKAIPGRPIVALTRSKGVSDNRPFRRQTRPRGKGR